MPKRIKSYLKKVCYYFLTKSLKKAARVQRLDELIVRLEEIVPDISNQYSSLKLNNSYLLNKVRNMHAFQTLLVDIIINEFTNPAIVDIGDSAGTHLQYITKLYSKNKKIKCLSINLDSNAVEKIKQKGLDAICTRVEDLYRYNINADILLCFEMLEHLMGPCEFLHDLSSKTDAKYLIVTVPYLKNSRIGLHHIRRERKDNVCAENTHIFELNPKDWRLLFKFTGWRVVFEKVYFQYSKKHWSWITKIYWKKFDFEGFYGAILVRDPSWSNLYKDY